jgi:hypothetical protein
LGHDLIQTTEKYLGVEQDLTDAPCDHLGLSSTLSIFEKPNINILFKRTIAPQNVDIQADFKCFQVFCCLVMTVRKLPLLKRTA